VKQCTSFSDAIILSSLRNFAINRG